MQHRPPPSPIDAISHLDRWRERLIDLSRRNPLIAMRLTRRSHLRLSRPDLARIFDRLVRERADYRFWFPAEIEVETPETSDTPRKRIRPRPDELLCEDLERRELLHILTNLYRRARSDFQERGLRILHVAFGSLEWKENATGPTITSPIVLVPVVLERPRPSEPFVLRVAEEEAFLNPALQLRLQRDFHLRLPPFPENVEESFRIHDYLDTIAILSGSLPEARVEKSAILTLLSFDKGVIHQDLTLNADRVVQHPLIRSLVGEPLPVLAAEHPGENPFLILDADASQEAAIRAARQGRQFVLIGPPGTGKSQTIANIIADQLAHGRTVLFVSEKIAALEVVYRRLRQAGLGDACLEVHSHLAQRARVVQELHRCLHLDEISPGIDDDSERRREFRDELDGVVVSLHQPRLPLNRSAHHAAQIVSQHPQLPLVRLDLPNLLERDQKWFDEATQAVGRLSRLGHLMQEGERFPWCRLRPRAFSLELRDELSLRIERIRQTRQDMIVTQHRIALTLGCEDAPFERLLQRLTLLERSPRPPRKWFNDDRSQDRLVRVEQCQQLRDAIRQQRDTLIRRHGPGIWQIESGSAVRLAACWERFRSYLGSGADQRILGLSNALREWHTFARQVIPIWESTAAEFARCTGKAMSTMSVRRLERLNEWFETLHRPPTQAARQRLEERYDATLFTLDLDRLIARFAGPYRSRWRRLDGQFRHDRDVLSRISRSGTIPSTIMEDMIAARDILRVERLERERYESRLRQLAKSIGIESMAMSPTLTPECEAKLSRLSTSLLRWQELIEPLESVLHESSPAELPLSALLDWLRAIEQPLTDFERLMNELARYVAPRGGSITELIDDLRQVELLRAWIRSEDAEPAQRREQFGPLWQGLEATDWDAIRNSLAWLSELREQFAPRPIPESIIDLATAAVLPDGKELQLAREQHEAARAELASLFDSDARIDADLLLQRLDELPDWFDWRDLPDWLERLDLGQFWQFVHRTALPTELWPALFEKAFFSAWLDAVCEHDPRLSHFRGDEHGERIRQFRELDREQLRHNARRVAHLVRHADSTPIPAPEIETLHRQALIRVRHRPLRQLFAEIPTLLHRVKPCLLMSPLSVSQFLTGSSNEAPISFDLVIFDEASQIPPEDALGAIYRGKQTIIVGDDKQLPPTSFFQTDGRFPSDTPIADEPYPSILDQARVVLPSYLLRWHYRSRDESLIAFSNQHFYDDRLMTFPNAHRDSRRGVVFHHVADGVYDRGGRRNNRREAEVVADLVFEQLRAQPDRTVGVIAFSQAQMSAIEDQLERRRRHAPDFEDFFRDDRLDSVFVRNLETVQGDERDVIFLSVGYGKDANGKPSLNFGPLNRAGGERRLNVAVTRAREKLVLVSSLTARELVGRSNTEGIRLLRRYLEYAQTGPAHRASAEGDYQTSIMWNDIRQRLEEWGYRVEFDIGCSAARVDIGVSKPQSPGRFFLGILGDGATYRTARTATERDRLRPMILESLGWRLHTVWTLDWIRKRGPELERLRRALDAAEQESSVTLRTRRRTNTLPAGS